MKLKYLHSKFIPCYCNWTPDFEPTYAENSDESLSLPGMIEKRYEVDQNMREHIKTVFHCKRCKELKFNALKPLMA